jgi:hypothetical protein
MPLHSTTLRHGSSKGIYVNMEIMTDEVDCDNRSKSKLYKRWGRFVVVPVDILTLGKHLTPEAVKMFLVLGSFENSDTGKIYPNYATIMKSFGTGRRENVAALLNELELFGWLYKKRNHARPNDYVLMKPDRICPTIEEAKVWKYYLSQKRLKQKEKKSKWTRAEAWKSVEDDRALAALLRRNRLEFENEMRSRKAEPLVEVPYGGNGLEVPYGWDTN